MSAPITRSFRTCAAALVALTGTATVQATADTFYVNGSCGADGWSGLSPTCVAPDGPKATIQAGIDAAVNGDTVIVANGIYTGPRNKNLDFGGKEITVRSTNGPEFCIIDCENDGRGFDFHSNETPQAVLDGFTVRNGAVSSGGGLRCEFSSPTIRNCTFSQNWAGYVGGGMFNYRSDPTLTNCTFTGNSAIEAGGGIGNEDGSGPTLTDCSFSGNSAILYEGGGVYNDFFCDTTLINCTLTGNSAGTWGGGLFSYLSEPTLTNCTFSRNQATRGGGIFSLESMFGPTLLANCILWANTPDEIDNHSTGSTVVTYSCIQGGYAGIGNIAADPLFADPANDDYHILSGSPCIDAANNAAVPPGIDTDLDGNPRFVDDPATPDTGNPDPARPDLRIVDMGAYEFPCHPCDMNCDGDVNSFDVEPFLVLLFGGGVPCNTCTGDVNGDGDVNAFDIEPFLSCLFP